MIFSVLKVRNENLFLIWKSSESECMHSVSVPGDSKNPQVY